MAKTGEARSQAIRYKLARWNFALVSLFLLILAWPGENDLRIRAIGMFFQLFGVYTVWRDLASNADRLGEDGIWIQFWRWACRPFRRSSVTAKMISVESGADVAWGTGAIRRNAPQGASIDERIKALEFNADQVDASLVAMSGDIKRQSAETRRAIQEVSAANERATARLAAEMKEVTLGHYPALVSGAAWLAVGVVITSLSGEVLLAANGEWGALWTRIWGTPVGR